jgi:hypothetical protein
VNFFVDTDHLLMHFALSDVTYVLLIGNNELVIVQKWEVNLGNLKHSVCGLIQIR